MTRQRNMAQPAEIVAEGVSRRCNVKREFWQRGGEFIEHLHRSCARY